MAGRDGVAAADHWPQHSRWQKATAVAPVNSTFFAEGCPIETADGLSLLFASNRSGFGTHDIWVSDRGSLASPWSEPHKLEAPISRDGPADFCPSPAYGRSLFFVSTRTDTDMETCGGPSTAGDIFFSRQSPAGGWSVPNHLACAPNGPNTSGSEFSPSLVETWYGTFLFYSTNGPAGDQDIFASRMRRDGTFGPGRVVKSLSTSYDDMMPNVRELDQGGFEVVFNSNRPSRECVAIESCNTQDVFMSVTWFVPGRWSKPVNLGGTVNTPLAEQRATLSRDGKRLTFGRSGEIFVSERR